MKSANQMWKESGTTLSFKDWLNREKAKYSNYDGQAGIILNKPLNDTIQGAVIRLQQKSGMKKEVSKGKTFGISNYLIIGTAVVVVGVIAYQIYKSKKDE